METCTSLWLWGKQDSGTRLMRGWTESFQNLNLCGPSMARQHAVSCVGEFTSLGRVEVFLTVPDTKCLVIPNPTQNVFFFFFYTSQLLLLTYVTNQDLEAQRSLVVETQKWQFQGHVPFPHVLPINWNNHIQLFCNEKLCIHSTNDLTLKIKAIGHCVPGTMKQPIWWFASKSNSRFNHF